MNREGEARAIVVLMVIAALAIVAVLVLGAMLLGGQNSVNMAPGPPGTVPTGI